MNTDLTHRSIALILCVFCVLVSTTQAEWSEAENLLELNVPLNASTASLTGDQLVICFIRGGYLWQAYRQDLDNPFIGQRIVSELGTNGGSIPDAWISADGLHLYYAEIRNLNGIPQRVIRTATRGSIGNPWVARKTFLEIHVNGVIDSSPALSADELTMIWYSQRFVGDSESRTFTASRPDFDSPFSNVREVVELSELGAWSPHLSDDGLTVYFTASHPDTGRNSIHKATRPSLDAPFGDFEVLDVGAPDLPASKPWLSPDEKTIYFNSNRGPYPDQKGIFVSHQVCLYSLLGDLNDDCAVNFADLALIAANWLIDCEETPDDPACVLKEQP